MNGIVFVASLIAIYLSLYFAVWAVGFVIELWKLVRK